MTHAHMSGGSKSVVVTAIGTLQAVGMTVQPMKLTLRGAAGSYQRETLGL